ncbi:MAG: UDP-N-acetylglucosamine 2-epimerase (non-hydrolyzing) [Candidatus Omnitrophica bacterium]|nr:UDP-N-acetylglucosamine 2-epimerase (non-hydrolyzing) [Candidatus Omnitrophota bacterium]
MNKRKKILVVFGTRPDAIKMASVIKQLNLCPDFKTQVCITAQHRQMLDQVLRIFNIKPDYDLDIMRKNQDLFVVTAKSLLQLKKVMLKSKPNLVLVQGDTTTTFAAALAAFYFKIPIGHVEAGLRTYDKYSPYPEEINRRLVTEISDFNFVPTTWAKNNLLKEGISKNKIFITGNTVVDALHDIVRVIKSPDKKIEFGKKLDFLKKKDKRIILITGHRRESFGEGFRNICLAIRELATAFPECNFVYPVHLNPNVQTPVRRILSRKQLPNVYLIEPLDYILFVYLMQKAYLILTDSGGIQEEAGTFGKPILVMRNITERPEGVKAGMAKLVGVNKEKIFRACKQLLTDKDVYDKMVKRKNPYGDGKAAKRIIGILRKKLG